MQVSSSESIAVAQKCDITIDLHGKCHSISKQIWAFSGNKIRLQEKLGFFCFGDLGFWGFLAYGFYSAKAFLFFLYSDT